MARSLPDFLTEARRRFGSAISANWSPPSDPLGDDPLALKAAEALEFLVSEAQRSTRGINRGHNRGVLLRKATLAILSDGSAFLPPDVFGIVGVSRSATLDVFDRAADAGEEGVQLIGHASCGGDYVRGFDRLIYPASMSGQSRYLLYNSNAKGTWVAGTVSAASSTGLTPSATPTYSSLPISSAPGAYDGLTLWTKRASDDATQMARVASWDGSAFTLYGSWPSYTPSAADAWSTLNCLDFDELLLYELGSRVVESSRYEEFEAVHQRLFRQFHPAIQARSSYER